MKFIKGLLIFSAIFLCFAGTADAQRKRPVRRPVPKATPKPPLPTLELRFAKEKVSNQRANVTRFVDVMAPIVASIETLDKENKIRKISKKSFDDNEANKKKVLEAIRGLRAGLVNLENEFRSKPALRKFLPQLEGIAALSAQSEDAAFAGRFVDARKPLLAAAGKLSDTMAVMP
jgi:hypothetical protein